MTLKKIMKRWASPCAKAVYANTNSRSQSGGFIDVTVITTARPSGICDGTWPTKDIKDNKLSSFKPFTHVMS